MGLHFPRATKKLSEKKVFIALRNSNLRQTATTAIRCVTSLIIFSTGITEHIHTTSEVHLLFLRLLFFLFLCFLASSGATVSSTASGSAARRGDELNNLLGAREEVGEDSRVVLLYLSVSSSIEEGKNLLGSDLSL